MNRHCIVDIALLVSIEYRVSKINHGIEYRMKIRYRTSTSTHHPYFRLCSRKLITHLPICISKYAPHIHFSHEEVNDGHLYSRLAHSDNDHYATRISSLMKTVKILHVKYNASVKTICTIKSPRLTADKQKGDYSFGWHFGRENCFAICIIQRP